jgi:hypothetical protein
MIHAPETFVIAEDEKLVLYDRAPGGAAELVLVERKRAVKRLEEADGVEYGVAVVGPGRTM